MTIIPFNINVNKFNIVINFKLQFFNYTYKNKNKIKSTKFANHVANKIFNF